MSFTVPIPKIVLPNGQATERHIMVMDGPPK